MKHIKLVALLALIVGCSQQKTNDSSSDLERQGYALVYVADSINRILELAYTYGYPEYDPYTYPNDTTFTIKEPFISITGIDTTIWKIPNLLPSSIHFESGKPPVADFYTEPTEGQAPLGVRFYNRSTGTQWIYTTWYFGDGDSEMGHPYPCPVNTAHNYATVGIYTVTLIMSNIWGSDTLIRKDYITVAGGEIGFPTP